MRQHENMSTKQQKKERINMIVVYFDKQTGAPHAVHWSKSFVFVLMQVFSYFSFTNGKIRTKKKGKHKNNTQNHT